MMYTPEQLREITEKAKKEQKAKAREWLNTEGYKLFENAAKNGRDCIILEGTDVKPFLTEILKDAGFTVEFCFTVPGGVMASWGNSSDRLEQWLKVIDKDDVIIHC